MTILKLKRHTGAPASFSLSASGPDGCSDVLSPRTNDLAALSGMVFRCTDPLCRSVRFESLAHTFKMDSLKPRVQLNPEILLSSVYQERLTLHPCSHSRVLEMSGASLIAQLVKNLPAMQDTWVRFLGWEDPLEKEMATHSSTLAWEIPWTEKPGRLQSVESQRVRHD